MLEHFNMHTVQKRLTAVKILRMLTFSFQNNNRANLPNFDLQNTKRSYANSTDNNFFLLTLLLPGLNVATCWNSLNLLVQNGLQAYLAGRFAGLS